MKSVLEPFGLGYVLWNAGAFFVAFILNSFVEWAVHRWIMHRPFKLIPYGYLHTTSHHVKFGSDESYHTQSEDLKKHILFTWKEYVLFPLFCLPVYAGLELLVQRPILIGCMASVFAGLQAFNSLHWRFHVPADTWFQRTWAFRFLKDHHRVHHGDMTKNFNVVLPVADILLGTKRWTES